MPPKKRATTAKPTPRKPAAKSSPKGSPRRKRVAVRSPIKFALFRCDKCKLQTNNPFARWFHTCLVGWTPSMKRTVAQRQASRKNLERARRSR